MDEMNRKISQQLALYMQQNGISTERVSLHTCIPEVKLRTGAKQPLNATEFLELCSYLQIKPEDI